MHSPHPGMEPFEKESDPRVRELFQAASEIRDLFVNYSPLSELNQGQFFLMRHLYMFEAHGAESIVERPGQHGVAGHLAV